MACGLHEIVRNTTQINSFFSDFRVVSRTISCIISEASLHFLFNSIPGAGVCEVPADVRVQGRDAGQVQQGVREHLARGLSQLFQGENSTQGKAENSTKERLKIPSKESDNEIVMLCKATLFERSLQN